MKIVTGDVIGPIRDTVPGPFLHPAQTLASPTQKRRSLLRRPGHRSFVHGELLTQGQILEGQLAVAAKEEGEKPKQVE